MNMKVCYTKPDLEIIELVADSAVLQTSGGDDNIDLEEGGEL